jgi:hypothetical protein
MTQNAGVAAPAETAMSPEWWPWAPVLRQIAGRAVLGAFRDPAGGDDWTVLCDGTDADGALVTGRWRPDTPDILTDVVRHASAFKAILSFETARHAARRDDAG